MTFDPRPPDLLALGSALRAARQNAGKGGMTLDQLAAATGISKPYLSNIETARAPGPPSEDKLRRIGKVLKVDVPSLLIAADWLRAPMSVRQALAASPDAATPRRADGAIDLDRMFAPAAASAGGNATGGDMSNTSTYPDALPIKPIPLINRVAAGKAGEFGDLSYPAGVADAYVAAPDLPDAPTAALFAVRVVGDSMAPEYREGDILIVGPGGGEPRDGDDCVVRTGEAENFATTFKRIFYLKDAAGEPASIRLVPLNPAHPERTLALEDVTGVYPLVYRLVPGRAAPPRKEPGKKASERILGK